MRIGLEAGPLSQWLFEGLSNAGLPVVCIAHMMRVNLFRPVHVKTISSQQRRALLTARKLILNKIRDIENDIRGLLRNFGLKVGLIGRIGFVARIRELLEDDGRFGRNHRTVTLS